MRKYEIPTVFYWPVEWHSLAYDKGYIPLSYTEALKISDDFEVGSHTITHRHLTDMSITEAKEEIADSRYILEDIFDTRITKFCPPRGYSSPQLHKVIGQYYEHYRLTKGSKLVHVHPNSGANGNRPWQEVLAEKDGDVEIWGHSWELDKFMLWAELEDALANLPR